jgi:hypothetical protein
MDFIEIGWGGIDWIHLAQYGPVAGSCEHCNKPSGSKKHLQIVEKLRDWLSASEDADAWGVFIIFRMG